jgi:hypothetical protein
MVAIAAFIAVLIVVTVSLTVSAGGILVRATAPLVGKVARAVSQPLLIFLVRESLDGTILDVRSKILQEGSTNWVKIFPDMFVSLSVLLGTSPGMTEGRPGRGLGKLVSVRLGELGVEQPTLEESKQGGSMVECGVGQHSHRTT